MTVDEKRIVYEDTLTDIEAHKDEYAKVIQLGKQLIEEMQQANESYDDDDAKIKNVQTCWSTTHSRLEVFKGKIDFLLKIKECKVELAGLRLTLDGHSKWFDTNHMSAQVELFRVSFI